MRGMVRTTTGTPFGVSSFWPLIFSFVILSTKSQVHTQLVNRQKCKCCDRAPVYLIELLGRVTKELESGHTFNLHLNPEWLELRAIIVTALEPYPDARGSVLRALGSADR